MVMNQSVASPTIGQVTGEISRQARPPIAVSALPLASAGLPAWLLWNQQSALLGSTTTKIGPLGHCRPQIPDHRGGKPTDACLDEYMCGTFRPLLDDRLVRQHAVAAHHVGAAPKS